MTEIALMCDYCEKRIKDDDIYWLRRGAKKEHFHEECMVQSLRGGTK